MEVMGFYWSCIIQLSSVLSYRLIFVNTDYVYMCTNAIISNNQSKKLIEMFT